MFDKKEKLEFSIQEKMEIITHKKDMPNLFELIEKQNAWKDRGNK